MAWQKIIVSGSDAELNSIGLVTSMSVGANQVIAPLQANTKLTGSFTGSFAGDGSNLTGIASTLSITGSTSGTDVVNLKTDGLTFSGGSNVTATVTDNTVTIGVTGLISQSSQVDVRQTTGIATIATTGSNTFVGDQNITGTVFITGSVNNTNGGFTGSFSGDGSGLTGVASTLSITGSTAGTDAVNLKTEGLLFSASNNVTATVSNNTVTIGVTGLVSESSQIDVRNTTGIATIATTGSNTFTGVQTISNTTNSTNYTDGALIVAGGVGIAKDVNISGSLTVVGTLTAATMSTQYVTSSQLNVGTSKITLNDDDLVRFAGISVYDSGSTAATGSLLWDSLNNHWIYEREDGGAYRSSIVIAGPKNYGNLGSEVGLVAGRIPVATGNDHIDTATASSSIYIDFATGKAYIEHGLYVTGSITASAYAGDGSGLTGVSATSVDFANITNKPALVSASAQIDHDLTTNFVANEHVDHSTVSISAGSGLSGGGDITATRTLSLDTGSAHFTDGVKTKLNTESVVSSSGQIKTVLNAEGVHSGSYLGTATTSNLPEGTNLYYLDSRVKDKLNTEGVISSSAQVVAGVAGQAIAPLSVNATSLTGSYATITNDLVVGGDLTVNGTTTTLNTTNVLVEDRYILLNSGSVAGAPAQGGIVVQDGGTPSGSALLYSTANSKNRWGVAENIAANATDATQTAYVATVTDMNVAAQASAVTSYQKPGNIKVDTNGDIYIWS